MQIVIEIDKQMYENAKNDLLCGAGIMINAIKNGTPLPQNATNGEMIQALFPNGAVAVMSYPSNKVGFITRDGNPDDNYVWYPTSWWNAKYKAESGDEE